jgi:nucleoside-diphosphate-sugar epimerase
MSDATATDVDARPGAGHRAVVLGGTGFLGRPTCRALAERGYEVIAVARRAQPVPYAAKVIPLDLAAADADEIATLLRDHEASVVVNAAGGMWGLTEAEMEQANVVLTERVVRAVAAAPTRPRLVQVGTVHEYGLVPIGTSMDEEMEPQPVTPYGRLKLRCTEVVTAATRAGDIDGVVLRVGNVTGAGQPAVSLLGVVASQLLAAHRENRRAILNLGPLGSQRDFLNLSDSVRAVALAATVPTLKADVINIGLGRATSARTMVHWLVEVSGVPAEINEAPATEPETQWQQMRIERARELLGWAPGADLTDGVRELWAHITEHATTDASSDRHA